MIVVARRIAGMLLLLGVVYLYGHSFVSSDGNPTSAGLFPTGARFFIGSAALFAWTVSLVWSGWLLVQGKPHPTVIGIAGLLAYVAFCMAFFGSLYFFLDKIHSEPGFWVAYVLNILPIVQFMAACVLGPGHSPGPAPLKS